MSLLETIIDATLEMIYLKNLRIESQTSIFSYIGALVTFFLIYVFLRQKSEPARSDGFFKTAFPADILRHHSTRLDLRMFLVNSFVLSAAYGLAILSGEFWHGVMVQALGSAFGPPRPLDAPPWVPIALTTVLDIVMIDLGYWVGHYLMHRIPALWEFHKVHHSAEVMTPLTELRQHPVEMILMPNLITFAGSMGYSGMVYVFGAAQPLHLWQANALLVIFFLTIGHLRHSHVWLPFTGILGRVLHSPAHHQIHHSDNPRHFDKNLGFSLSIWDWAFGTLWIPRKDEKLVFGIGAETQDFRTLRGSFYGPFAKAAAPFRGRLKPQARSETQ